MDNNSKDDEATPAAEIALSMHQNVATDSMPPETQENDDDDVEQSPQETQPRNANAVAAPPPQAKMDNNSEEEDDEVQGAAEMLFSLHQDDQNANGVGAAAPASRWAPFHTIVPVRDDKGEFVFPSFPEVKNKINHYCSRPLEKELLRNDVTGNRLVLRKKDFEKNCNFYEEIKRVHKDDVDKKLGNGIRVKVFDKDGTEYKMKLKTQKSGSSHSYMLVGDNWKKFVRKNKFKKQVHNSVALWLFTEKGEQREEGELFCFLVAVAKVNKFIHKKKKKDDDDDGGGGTQGHLTRSAAALAIRG